MTSSSISELALKQLSDYDAHHPGRIFEQGPDFLTVEQAYQLQIAVAEMRKKRGEAVAGYKIGCLSPAIREQLGLDTAVFGHVFSSEIHPDGAALDSRRFDGLEIEGEFALRLARDVTDVRAVIAKPLDVISAAFPVIELHNCVFRSPRRTAQELIANNALHAGIVTPQEEPRLNSLDELLSEAISVRSNGAVLGTSEASTIPGGPFGSLLDLFGRLQSFGIELKAGHIVLTGSPLPMYRVRAGDQIEVSGARLGNIGVTIR